MSDLPTPSPREGVTSSSPVAVPPTTLSASWILAFVGICALEKLVAIFVTGLTGDEAYTLVISRRFALSYFDHPPLHQWIAHAFVSAFGEGRAARLPFWAMIVALNLPLHAMTRRWFGRGAAAWTVFAFNAAPYNLTWPDGFIIPDAPLALGLAAAGWALTDVLSPPPGRPDRSAAPWLIVGAALGLAGLSKYSAAFVPLGLLGFLLAAPRHRHWLWDWRPYAGAALGLAVFAPALIWNARHGWVSFAFQSARAADSLTFGATAWAALGAGLGAQVASLSPWVGVPLAMGLATATRSRVAEGGERLLLWLAAPSLLLFALLPLLGHKALPHWFNSGWLFAYPLAGRWLDGASIRFQSAWSRTAAGLAAAVTALYLIAVILGPLALPGWSRDRGMDPTSFSYDWPDLAQTPAWRGSGDTPPDFAVVDNWRVGGKLGVGLGPRVPICAFTADPRGFAFLCDPSAWIGKDAMIVALKKDAARTLPALANYFDHVDPPVEVAIGRFGRAERSLVLQRAHRLLRAYPLPYGSSAGR